MTIPWRLCDYPMEAMCLAQYRKTEIIYVKYEYCIKKKGQIFNRKPSNIRCQAMAVT